MYATDPLHSKRATFYQQTNKLGIETDPLHSKRATFYQETNKLGIDLDKTCGVAWLVAHSCCADLAMLLLQGPDAAGDDNLDEDDA